MARLQNRSSCKSSWWKSMITDGLEYSFIEKHLDGSWDLEMDQNRCASEFLAPHTIHIISLDPSPATKTADFGCAIPHPIGGMLNSYPEAPVCIGSVFVGSTHMLNEDHSRQIVVNKLFVNPLGYGSPKDIPGSCAKHCDAWECSPSNLLQL